MNAEIEMATEVFRQIQDALERSAIAIREIESRLDAVEAEQKKFKTLLKLPCHYCNGTGHVARSEDWTKPGFQKVRCPVCGGSGKLDQTVTEKVGL